MLKIIYPGNDATLIPRALIGSRIQIVQWLRGEQYVPFIKTVLKFNDEQHEEYDDGQGRRFDILDEELQ